MVGRQRGPLLPLWLGLVLLVGACAEAVDRPYDATDVLGRKVTDLTVWVGPSPSLHPHRANGHLTAAMFSPLVASDPVSRLPAWGSDAPEALLDDISSSDLRRWELTIKEGWQWHDGSPVVADDVERGWRAAIADGLPLISTVSDVRAVGETTVVVVLSAPFGQLPHLLTHPTFLPLPPLAAALPDRFDAAPVGNGPYRLAGRDGDALMLEVVDAHPAVDRTSVDRLRVELRDDPSVNADVAVGTDGDVVPPGGPGGVLRSDLVRLPGRQLAYLSVPLTDPRFRDQAVRTSLALAVDGDALVAAVLGDAVEPADRLVGPGFARGAAVECPVCGHDPDRAAASWPTDFEGPLRIWFAGDGGHDAVVDFIVRAWSEVLGIEEIEPIVLPAADLLDALASTRVDGPFRLSWQADVSHPVRLIDPLFGPRGSANDARFRSDAVTALLRDAGGDRDLVGSLETYGELEEVVLADGPVIPLWFSTIPVASRPDVGGIVLDGEGRLHWPSLRF